MHPHTDMYKMGNKSQEKENFEKQAKQTNKKKDNRNGRKGLETKMSLLD